MLGKFGRFALPKTTGARMGIAAFAAATIALVGAHEGLRLNAYIPIPGDVPTICYGETKDVKLGDRKTKAECDEMFARRLAEFETGMRKCITNPDAIPDQPYRVFLGMSYNVGTGAFCRSTLVRKLNAGDLEGACNELPKWNKAGGRVVRGLTIRREHERKLCLEGVG